jgi:predicted ATPase
MFIFKIIQKCYQNASSLPGDDADFYIELDAWDDYTYHVLYHLHATKRLTGTANEYLGYIKFMHPGQTSMEIYALEKRMGDKPFAEVPEDFVSLTFSMEVYRGLNRYVQDTEARAGIVDQLHLILDKESPYYEMVKNDPCFLNGVLRDTTMENFALQKAQSLLLAKECLYNLRKESFKFKLNNADDFISFDFTCLNDEDFVPEERKLMVPNGCVVFIGGNGSGKSTAMYKLAKLMYTEIDKRRKPEYKEYIGELKPNNVGVSKMIVISYSPFDNFMLPAWDENPEESAERFIYCGIRDYIAERDLLLQEQDGKYEQSEEVILADRQNRTQLKSIQELANEFVEQFTKLKQDSKRRTIWEEITESAEELHPELSKAMGQISFGPDDGTRIGMFKNLSTGNKYIFHMLATIIGNIEDDSLILFDEPENHIHPPLLSFLLTAIRRVLHNYNSVVFISTHSPVIIQETFANNVYVIRRIGEGVTMTHPNIETYGANIGEITSEVFNLTSDNISYYKLFSYLYGKWTLRFNETPESMLAEFESKLGHRISEQLSAFLVDLWCQDNPEVEES